MGGQTAGGGVGRAWACLMEGQVGSSSNDIQSIPMLFIIFNSKGDGVTDWLRWDNSRYFEVRQFSSETELFLVIQFVPQKSWIMILYTPKIVPRDGGNSKYN